MTRSQIDEELLEETKIDDSEALAEIVLESGLVRPEQTRHEENRRSQLPLASAQIGLSLVDVAQLHLRKLDQYRMSALLVSGIECCAVFVDFAAQVARTEARRVRGPALRTW